MASKLKYMKKQEISNMASLRFKCNKRNRQCMCPGCSENAINSHLLQRNGVLNHVAEDGHVYELSKSNYYNNSTNGISFRRIGINNAHSYHLFCFNHDTTLFKPIEGTSLDYNNYNHQLLFTYRTICTDIRKKEIDLNYYDDLIQKYFYDKEKRARILIGKCGCLDNIRDYTFYKKEVERELLYSIGSFVFEHYTYPKIGLYASSAFSYIEYNDYEKKVMDSNPWECCFLNIIPTQYNTEIIIGYHRDYTNSNLIDLSKKLYDSNQTQLGLELTNLLLHVDDWGLSPSLFKRIPQERKDRFLIIFTQYLMNYDSSLWVDFDLFEGVL